MDNVVKLKGETPNHGEDAVAQVVKWLRQRADDIENGSTRPVHKAVLVTYEEAGGHIRTKTAFCNANTVERSGMLTLAIHDMAADYASD